MRRFANAMTVLAALVLAMTFAGCGDGLGKGKGGSGDLIWVSRYPENPSTVTLHKDGTFEFSIRDKLFGEGTYEDKTAEQNAAGYNYEYYYALTITESEPEVSNTAYPPRLSKSKDADAASFWAYFKKNGTYTGDGEGNLIKK